MQLLKKPTITETIRLHRLCWFGDVQRKEGNRIPKSVLYMVDQEIDGGWKNSWWRRVAGSI
jgi:hypothetical protein